MRTEVDIRRDGATGRCVLDVDDDQFHLFRRAVIVFSYQEERPAARTLITGSREEILEEPFQVGLAYDDVAPAPVSLTFAQLHALHGVLTSLPTAIWSEEDFVERVGHFRETLLQAATSLTWSYAKLTDDAEERGERT